VSDKNQRACRKDGNHRPLQHNFKVTSQNILPILFLGRKPLDLAHRKDEGITQGCDYYEIGIFESYFRNYLPYKVAARKPYGLTGLKRLPSKFISFLNF
jgi:hypothetical protein